MEYKILVSSDSNELAQMVNQHITEGWQPLGGVATSSVIAEWENSGNLRTEYEYCQAMVRMPLISQEEIERIIKTSLAYG